MFFTQDDYKKIQQWLTKNSVKDTEFNEANIPFNGEETITIVQGNQNKKVFLKDLIAQVFNLGISDFVNITDKYDAPNISLEEAVRLIPSRARKTGLVITFLNKDGNWQIYQFKGVLNQWNVLDTWEDLFDWEKLIIDSILPDEEDLTKSEPDANGNIYLSLKDREYNPEDFSGLGRIILRKSIVEVEDPIYGKVKKNILYQDMITQSNTIYEIRYDFDLNGQEITIPEGCVLDFQGGSISNGSVVGNYTTINAKPVKIFNITTAIKGTWNVVESFSEWFGGNTSNYNNTPYIQAALAFPAANGLRLLGIYYITSPIALSKYNVKITGSLGRNNEGFAIRCRSDFSSVNVNGKEVNSMFYRTNNTSIPIIFEGLTLSGAFKANTVIEPDAPYRVSAIRMDNVSVQQFYEAGVIVHSADYNSFHQVEFQYCCVGLEIGGLLVNYENPLGDFGPMNLYTRQANHVIVDNCSFIGNEVGIIASRVTDLILTSNLFGYNSLCSMRLYQIQSVHIKGNYIEGDCNYNFRIYKDRQNLPDYGAKTGVVSDDFKDFVDVDFRAYIRIETRTTVYIDKLYVSNFYVRSYVGASGDAHLNKNVPGIDGSIFMWYNWVPVSLSIDSIATDNTTILNGEIIENAYDIISYVSGPSTDICENSIKANFALKYRHFYYVNNPVGELNGIVSPIINSCNLVSNKLKYGVDVFNANDGGRIIQEFPEDNFVLKEIHNKKDMYYSPLNGSPGANSIKVLWDSLSYDNVYKAGFKIKPTESTSAYIQVKIVYDDDSTKTLRFLHTLKLNEINYIYYYFSKNEFNVLGKKCVEIYISDYTPLASSYRTPFKLYTEGCLESIDIVSPHFISYNPKTEVPICIFNITLNKPVWYNNGKWVDATGANV